MNSLISNPITTLISFTIAGKFVEIQHPSVENLSEISALLAKEDLDVRRLLPVAHHQYPSMGETWIHSKWQEALSRFQKDYPEHKDLLKQITNQAEGILRYKPIPAKSIAISDPFNMRSVEKEKSIQDLAEAQIQNIIIAKSNNEIIGIGRLLEVEGSVEIVSLLTKPKWRGKGIATKIIDELFERSVVRPVYSFQLPALVPFYFKRYKRHGNVEVPPFYKLPEALQRDLFYMNIFWGPYTILRIINSK